MLNVFTFVVAGLVSVPGSFEISIGSDQGVVVEPQGRIQRVRPGDRPTTISIGSDQGVVVEPQGRIQRVRPGDRKP